MKAPHAQLFFLPAGEGEQRLCVFHAASGEPRGRVLFVHPFAEEMNKSRRMVALACRALAEAGFAVLQIDLRGCGDSSADFGDATWADWLEDVRRGLQWLDTHAGTSPLWLWGLRAGSLVACEALTREARACNLLVWQPSPAGKLVLQQFLRLKLAAEMAGGAGKGLMDGLKRDLAEGRSVEVAGYRVNAALAQGLEAARLAPPSNLPAGRLVWLEVSNREGAALSPVSEQTLQAWREAGWQVESRIAAGPGFWATAEIELAPDLLQQTVAAL